MNLGKVDLVRGQSRRYSPDGRRLKWILGDARYFVYLCFELGVGMNRRGRKERRDFSFFSFAVKYVLSGNQGTHLISNRQSPDNKKGAIPKNRAFEFSVTNPYLPLATPSGGCEPKTRFSCRPS